MLWFYTAYASARDLGAPPDVVAQYQLIYDAMAGANAALRGLSEPIPLCTSSLTRTPAPGAYTKPLMLLTDEFTVSTADSVANMLQSAGRARLYRMRTNGPGGHNTHFGAGPVSSGT